MTLSTIRTDYQHETVARNYDRDRFSSFSGRVFNALEKRAIRRIVRPLLRQTMKPDVLDVPCGTGRITELLLGLGLEVTGGDISAEMMEVAKDRCCAFGKSVFFSRLDLEKLELPANSFDLVTCIRLFHHLDSTERQAVLCELARVSRKYVLINVSLSSPFYRWRRRLKRFLGQGVSKASSTWTEIRNEIHAAGLALRARRFVLRFFSEDLFLLLEKNRS